MLETIATIFLVTVGVVFGLVVLSYPLYFTYLLIAKAIGGSVSIVRGYRNVRMASVTPNVRLGLTMADGGDRIKKKKARKTK